MQRRTRDEILAEVLEVCLEGASKTRIVYRTNMNFRTVVPYVASLSEHGFIELDDRSQKYKTTEKGVKLLDMIQTIRENLA